MYQSANHQKGFGLVAVLLVFAAIAGITCAGYLVWQKSRPTSKSTSANVQIPSKSTNDSAKNAQWNTYKNTEYDFQFEYPATWGSLEAQPLQSSTAAKASGIAVKVNGTATASILFAEAGWKGDASAESVYDITYDDCQGPVNYIAYNQANTCVAVSGDSATGLNNERVTHVATVFGQKKLETGKGALTFVLLTPSTSQLSDTDVASLKTVLLARSITQDKSLENTDIGHILLSLKRL